MQINEKRTNSVEKRKKSPQGKKKTRNRSWFELPGQEKKGTHKKEGIMTNVGLAKKSGKSVNGVD